MYVNDQYNARHCSSFMLSVLHTMPTYLPTYILQIKRQHNLTSLISFSYFRYEIIPSITTTLMLYNIRNISITNSH